MRAIPLRLTPGIDLRQALERWMGEQKQRHNLHGDGSFNSACTITRAST
jgi:hypothetical protein